CCRRDCHTLLAAGNKVNGSARLHLHIANVRDLRPDEHPVHMLGTSMNRGDVADPQKILSVAIQLPHDLRTNLNDLRRLGTDLSVLNLQITEHDSAFPIENVQPRVEVRTARARSFNLQYEALSGLGLESKAVDVARLANGA